MGKNGYYAVRVGRVPGVYQDWNTCMEQTGGYSGAVFRGFRTESEAVAWLSEPETSSFALQQAAQSGAGLRVPNRLGGSHDLDVLGNVGVPYSPCAVNRDRTGKGEMLEEVFSQPVKRSKIVETDRLWKMWFDGCSRGNPGPAGGGFLLESECGKVLYKTGVSFGIGTNNVAEYRALITGMRVAVNLGAPGLLAYGDSQLVVCQINGEYKVGPEMAPYHREVLLLSRCLLRFQIRWIPRVENRVADELAGYGVSQVTGDDRFVSEFPSEVTQRTGASSGVAVNASRSIEVSDSKNSWRLPDSGQYEQGDGNGDPAEGGQSYYS